MDRSTCFRGRAGRFERIDRSGQQAVGDKTVEPADDEREPQTRRTGCRANFLAVKVFVM